MAEVIYTGQSKCWVLCVVEVIYTGQSKCQVLCVVEVVYTGQASLLCSVCGGGSLHWSVFSVGFCVWWR